jgi:uncharacterized protein (TIGR02145 family)
MKINIARILCLIVAILVRCEPENHGPHENGSIIDYDGNEYQIIQIGGSWWMKENLKTTHFNDGSEIPLEPNLINWCNMSEPAYCWYDNEPQTYKSAYGALYNWYTISDKLCPSGWHVPSDAEWSDLVLNLGGEGVAGQSMKELGTYIPGGYRSGSSGLFISLDENAMWWSASESDINEAWYWQVTNKNSYIERMITQKKAGLSVRCVKND